MEGAETGEEALELFARHPSRRRADRHHAARHRRLRGVPLAAPLERRPDHHGHGPGRHPRRGRRPRGGRRRLPHQAVRARRSSRPASGRCCAGPARPSTRPPARCCASATSRSCPTRAWSGSASARCTSRRPSSGCSASWRRARAGCSAARSSSSGCGATATSATAGSSTSTSAGCAPRSRPTPPTPGTSPPSGASATSSRVTWRPPSPRRDRIARRRHRTLGAGPRGAAAARCPAGRLGLRARITIAFALGALLLSAILAGTTYALTRAQPARPAGVARR